MFHFTIRDVLLVAVIVALAVGWWVDRSGLARKLNSNAWKISGLEVDLHFLNKEIRQLRDATVLRPPSQQH